MAVAPNFFVATNFFEVEALPVSETAIYDHDVGAVESLSLIPQGTASVIRSTGDGTSFEEPREPTSRDIWAD